MLDQIKELLTNSQVRAKVQSAKTRGEAVDAVVTAGAERGFSFDASRVAQAFAPRARQLSERELLMVSGGRMAESAPRLCHTDSCGGNHAGCCST